MSLTADPASNGAELSGANARMIKSIGWCFAHCRPRVGRSHDWLARLDGRMRPISFLARRFPPTGREAAGEERRKGIQMISSQPIILTTRTRQVGSKRRPSSCLSPRHSTRGRRRRETCEP